MNKLRKGFTLVELIVVIGVLAILAVGAVLAFRGVQDNARRSALRDDASRLISVITNHNAESLSNPVILMPLDTTMLGAGGTTGLSTRINNAAVGGALVGEASNAITVTNQDAWSLAGLNVHPPAGFDAANLVRLHVRLADGASPPQVILVGLPNSGSGTALVSSINFSSNDAMGRAIQAVTYRPSAAGTGLPGSFVVDEARVSLWDTRTLLLPARPGV
jgi:prepilin-type N-terminal cleavage/methylation domain-containing protein